MRSFAASAVGAALLTVQTTSVRVSREKNPAVKLDVWSQIADGFKLPTEDDVDDMVSVRSVDFDWRAWGEEFEALTFDQQADHVNAYHQQPEFLKSNETTFKQRYWLNTKAWAGAAKRGPIFVIISPYGGFSSYAYGSVGEMAREMGAMVVQIEGRFAPDSLPFGKHGFDHEANRIGLASGENAMRDYIMLISHLRNKYDPEWVCPTATYGGSLAGMYAAWLRFKFPHVIDMSLASGSPMSGYPGTSDTLAFTRTITEAWEDSTGSSECVDVVRDAFRALQGHPCSQALWTRVYNEATYWAYPPRGRTSSICARAKHWKAAGADPITIALDMCGSDCATGCPASASPTAPDMWSYFSCTQVVNPIGSNGVSDFFLPPAPWKTENREQTCMDQWGVGPQKEGNYHADLFGWHRLSKLKDNGKRMMFSFGTYDAWTGFALSKTNISSELPVVVIKGGCHCSDLIGSRSEDTKDMLEARAQEKAIIKRWVKEVQQL